MSNAMKASQDLQLLASKFKQIVEISEVLEKIGSLEQAARDATIVKDEAYKASEEAKATLEGKKAELKDAQKKIVLKQEEALQIVSEAEKKAAEIVAAAYTKANDVIAKTEARKQEIAKSAQEIHEKSQSQAKEIELKSQELQFINDQLKEAKRKIAAFGAE